MNLNTSFWEYTLKKMLRKLRYGNIKVTLPNGETETFYGKLAGPYAELKLHKKTSIKNIILGGSMAFCEEYISGNISSNNIQNIIEIGSKHNSGLNTEGIGGLKKNLKTLYNKLIHLLNFNSIAGSKNNISKHYDLGDEFYSLWLDKSLAYSSAIFETQESSLANAQVNKYKRITTLLDIKDGEKILEIGCGWGGFSEYLAKNFEIDLTSITISKKQFYYAKERMSRARLDKKANIKFIDYRNVSGHFDKIVSIEMFEAVGESYWKIFFKKIKSLLNPSGLAVLQIITIDNAFFNDYRRKPDFIQKYIFPGGMLPSMDCLNYQFSKAHLQMLSCDFFGNDYAKTLAIWRKNFNANWHKISKLGFDEKFKRIWNLYFSYCEGGFKGKSINVCQIKLISGNHE